MIKGGKEGKLQEEREKRRAKGDTETDFRLGYSNCAFGTWVPSVECLLTTESQSSP